jgi:cell wall-associated NlpC family hydrolase
VALARTYIGTPFRHQGRTPGHGLDCIGVMVCIGRELGLFDYDLPHYPRLPHGDMALLPHVARAGFRPLTICAAQPGDVLVFRVLREPQHVALLTDCGVLHAWLQAGAVVEHRLEPFWQSRMVGAFAFPNVI